MSPDLSPDVSPRLDEVQEYQRSLGQYLGLEGDYDGFREKTAEFARNAVQLGVAAIADGAVEDCEAAVLRLELAARAMFSSLDLGDSWRALFPAALAEELDEGSLVWTVAVPLACAIARLDPASGDDLAADFAARVQAYVPKLAKPTLLRLYRAAQALDAELYVAHAVFCASTSFERRWEATNLLLHSVERHSPNPPSPRAVAARLDVVKKLVHPDIPPGIVQRAGPVFRRFACGIDDAVAALRLVAPDSPDFSCRLVALETIASALPAERLFACDVPNVISSRADIALCVVLSSALISSPRSPSTSRVIRKLWSCLLTPATQVDSYSKDAARVLAYLVEHAYSDLVEDIADAIDRFEPRAPWLTVLASVYKVSPRPADETRALLHRALDPGAAVTDLADLLPFLRVAAVPPEPPLLMHIWREWSSEPQRDALLAWLADLCDAASWSALLGRASGATAILDDFLAALPASGPLAPARSHAPVLARCFGRLVFVLSDAAGDLGDELSIRRAPLPYAGRLWALLRHPGGCVALSQLRAVDVGAVSPYSTNAATSLFLAAYDTMLLADRSLAGALRHDFAERLVSAISEFQLNPETLGYILDLLDVYVSCNSTRDVSIFSAKPDAVLYRRVIVIDLLSKCSHATWDIPVPDDIALTPNDVGLTATTVVRYQSILPSDMSLIEIFLADFLDRFFVVVDHLDAARVYKVWLLITDAAPAASVFAALKDGSFTPSTSLFANIYALHLATEFQAAVNSDTSSISTAVSDGLLEHPSLGHIGASVLRRLGRKDLLPRAAVAVMRCLAQSDLPGEAAAEAVAELQACCRVDGCSADEDDVRALLAEPWPEMARVALADAVVAMWTGGPDSLLREVLSCDPPTRNCVLSRLAGPIEASSAAAVIDAVVASPDDEDLADAVSHLVSAVPAPDFSRLAKAVMRHPREGSLRLLRLLSAGDTGLRATHIDLVDLALPSAWHHGASWYCPGTRPPRSASGYVGLKNMGCLCYMNATLQMLFSTRAMRSRLLALPPVPGDDVALLRELQAVFASLLLLDAQYHHPRQFVSTYRHYGDEVDVNQQMDAEEFLVCLFDQLEAAQKTAGCGPIVEDIFRGKLRWEVLSDQCEHRSARDEPYYSISLDVLGHSSIDASLDSYMRDQLLTGDNAYHCDSCNAKVEARRHARIAELPPTLILHLKRFEFDYATMERWKLNDRVQFPLELDVSRWCLDSCAPSYTLRGIVIHSGSHAESGHYYAFLRISDSDWIEINDRSVYPFDISDLDRNCFGGSGSSSAYILFYDKNDNNDKIDDNENDNKNDNNKNDNIAIEWLNSMEKINEKTRLERILHDSNISRHVLDLVKDGGVGGRAAGLGFRHMLHVLAHTRDEYAVIDFHEALRAAADRSADDAAAIVAVVMGPEELRSALLDCPNSRYRVDVGDLLQHVATASLCRPLYDALNATELYSHVTEAAGLLRALASRSAEIAWALIDAHAVRVIVRFLHRSSKSQRPAPPHACVELLAALAEMIAYVDMQCAEDSSEEEDADDGQDERKEDSTSSSDGEDEWVPRVLKQRLDSLSWRLHKDAQHEIPDKDFSLVLGDRFLRLVLDDLTVMCSTRLDALFEHLCFNNRAVARTVLAHVVQHLRVRSAVDMPPYLDVFLAVLTSEDAYAEVLGAEFFPAIMDAARAHSSQAAGTRLAAFLRGDLHRESREFRRWLRRQSRSTQ